MSLVFVTAQKYEILTKQNDAVTTTQDKPFVSPLFDLYLSRHQTKT